MKGWSRERPTAPGLYWAMWRHSLECTVVRVTAGDRQVVEVRTGRAYMADLVDEWRLRESAAELGRNYAGDGRSADDEPWSWAEAKRSCVLDDSERGEFAAAWHAEFARRAEGVSPLTSDLPAR